MPMWLLCVAHACFTQRAAVYESSTASRARIAAAAEAAAWADVKQAEASAMAAMVNDNGGDPPPAAAQSRMPPTPGSPAVPFDV